MGVLSKKRLDKFLHGSKIIAKIATVNPDGSPYVVPVWHEWDGKILWVISKPTARYAQNLKKDPRIAVCIETPKLPYIRVMMEGSVDLLPADHDWLPMGRRMARRYLGRGGLDYIEKTKDWERLFIKVIPEKISSWDGGVEGHEWGKRLIRHVRRPPRQPG